MKSENGNIIAVIVIVVIFLFGCRSKQEHKPTIPILDTLANGSGTPVHAKIGSAIEAVPNEDTEKIFLALARTPKIDYEVNALTMFPDKGFPMAACARTHGFLVFLCRCDDDQWHVFRIASYISDPFPKQNSTRQAIGSERVTH